MQEHLYHHFSTLDSTNILALAMAEQGAEHGTVIHADRQSGGRGRGKRKFASPVGGLYFSLILRPELDLVDLPLLTLAAGTGLCLSLREALSVPVMMKWPNDLYVYERKMAGILTESGPIRGGQAEFVVIGVGVNVSTTPELFPQELRQKSISLVHVAEHCPSIEVLLPLFVNAMQQAAQRLAEAKEKLLADWRTFDYLKGRALRYLRHEEEIPATGIGLAPDGQYIIVDTQGVEHQVLAGDLNPVKPVS
ncbi:MAG: biotin--[acetyl-CoA-carboxylase] ligase [Candidatus Electrothrix aestuarii]|uniref:Biotin--[acetyl-CoA-carboxylase] ligase n=1 Tax=Candidatus Electrothrix aestuarii TaxID=3062594 RepID=A0AAU8LVJ7_9BACT|nr:biotin--[acetyl-CoA-carboxylase] ligase [Candidatus Electrothrix aestuarii]